MKRIYIALALAFAVSAAMSAQEWAPAGNDIKTPWAAQVNPATPLPEYHRPQMVRAASRSRAVQGRTVHVNSVFFSAMVFSSAFAYSGFARRGHEKGRGAVSRFLPGVLCLWYFLSGKWKTRKMLSD